MKLRIAPLPHGAAATDLVCHGESSVDVSVGLGGGWPATGTDKVDAAALGLRLGGQAATASVTCRRLGWSVRYLGVLGRDEWGERIAAGLASEGVEANLIWREDVASRSAVVVVDIESGRRMVLAHRPEALDRTPAEFPADERTLGRLVLTDATDLASAVHLAQSARRRGIPVIVDVDRDAPGVEDLLHLADLLVVPAMFAEAFTGASSPGDALARLAARFEPAVAVATLGADGSLALVGGREIRARPPEVEVVDTTGAGDAFRGGLAAGWLERGADATPEFLLTFANAVAALSCRRLGAQTALPARIELDRFL